MKPKLRALEKNILKYRAIQMILLLHRVESLRTFLLGSIRVSDTLLPESGERLPPGVRKPMVKALNILTSEEIITDGECEELKNIIEVRNHIGHRIHRLVEDISAPGPAIDGQYAVYDYGALERLEQLRQKIEAGMARKFVLQIASRELAFEQAEATYLEELARLRKRIDKQFLLRSQQKRSA